MRSQWNRAVVFSLLLAGSVVATQVRSVQAQVLLLSNPHWQINLTDAGYSDYLGDWAPGFEGREYLSGEWAAAVSYKLGANAPTPTTWLEKNFIYPDWTTNSNFNVVSGITQTGANPQGLPIAESLLSNGELQIALKYEMLDTTTGTRLGTAPASASTGSSVLSDRYILQQTYTITNLSSTDAMSDLSLYQFLHSLEAQKGVYDNRNYGGVFGAYQYDVTETGVTGYTQGTTLEDHLGFRSDVAPTSFEIGQYGIASVDSHSLGKPSVGTHLSVESGTLNNNDALTPAEMWIAGAQKWNFGTLAPGGSISHSVQLTLATGTVVNSSESGTAHIEDNSQGNSSGGGQVDFAFSHIDAPGLLEGEFEDLTPEEIGNWVNQGLFASPNFDFGSVMQLWNLEFSGSFNGAVQLVFHYDPSLLFGLNESELAIYHYNGHSWDLLPSVLDPINDTITVTTLSLSPFAVGKGENIVRPVPEPTTMLTGGLGLGLLAYLGLRRARRV